MAPDAPPTDQAAAHRAATRSWASVHPWGSGRVFQNFADPDLEHWAEAYYGPNYPRLVRVSATTPRICSGSSSRYPCATRAPSRWPAVTAVEATQADGSSERGTIAQARRVTPVDPASALPGRAAVQADRVQAASSWLRPGIVARSRWSSGCWRHPPGRWSAVVAPPGYGKMTLLAQWPSARATGSAGFGRPTRQRPRRAADLPGGGAGPGRADLPDLPDPGLADPPCPAYGRPGWPQPCRRRPNRSTWSSTTSSCCDNRQCLDALAQLAMHLWRILLGPGLSHPTAAATGPAARPGPAGGGGSGRPGDGPGGGAGIAGGAETRLTEHAAELYRRTEGRPAGLYLAALALQAAGPTPGQASCRGGVRRG